MKVILLQVRQHTCLSWIDLKIYKFLTCTIFLLICLRWPISITSKSFSSFMGFKMKVQRGIKPVELDWWLVSSTPIKFSCTTQYLRNTSTPQTMYLKKGACLGFASQVKTLWWASRVFLKNWLGVRSQICFTYCAIFQFTRDPVNRNLHIK